MSVPLRRRVTAQGDGWLRGKGAEGYSTGQQDSRRCEGEPASHVGSGGWSRPAGTLSLRIEIEMNGEEPLLVVARKTIFQELLSEWRAIPRDES